MHDTPQILHIPAQSIAFVHLTVPRSQIREVMGPGLQEVYAALAAQGVTPTGPWRTHHRRMDPATFDFEICVPVAAPITAMGRVHPGVMPAMEVARVVYRGSYEGLGDAWGQFMTWIAAQGRVGQEDLWECYLSGPESSSDPAQWATELNRPLRP